MSHGDGKRLTEGKKSIISTLKDNNKLSNRQIAKKISCSKFFWRNFVKYFENYGKNQVTGRPLVMSSAGNRRLIQSAANNFRSARLKTIYQLVLDGCSKF